MLRSSGLSRRLFLAGSAVVAGTVALGAPVRAEEPIDPAALPSGLFTFGVASGDPLSDGVVLWTKLAPEASAGATMPARPVLVEYEIAHDERFSQIASRGSALATPEWGHSVHIEAAGLQPDREYFYRFKAGRDISPIGRTRTAPSLAADLRTLRFAFASCQNYQDGYFTVYRHMVEEDLRFVAFLGDFLYESKPRDTTIRKHSGGDEPYTLEQYRARYAQYHSDADLRAARAAFPWIVTWDDHEVDNNWAGPWPQDPDKQKPEAFAARKLAAFQAYYEHMPLRPSSLPNAGKMRLFRRLTFGQLATLHVLDARQYRTQQVTSIDHAYDPASTMLGAQQKQWLTDGLRQSDTTWNLLANQVMWASHDQDPGSVKKYDFDNWDGYRAERREMLSLFGELPEKNPVVLTGDRHCTWVCDLKPDFDDPKSPVVGAEITGTSISSGGDPDTAAFHRRYDPIMAESPHWKYIDNRRGYVLCTAEQDRFRGELRVVDTVWNTAGSTIHTAATFDVEAGKPGITATSTEPETRRHQAPTGHRYDVDDDHL